MARKPRSCSRRTLLEAGLLAAVGTALPPSLLAADAAESPVIRKRIPSTGQRIAAMGIGTNAFRMNNYDELRRVLRRMHELGGQMIDTAAAYGDSEAVIGKVLAELGIRDQMFLATKFNAQGVGQPPRGGRPGRPPPPAEPYGRASFERSLMRLQTDHVDLLYAHFLASAEPLMPLMHELKEAGKARYIGITTVEVDEHPEIARLMRKYRMDFVQVDYSIGNRDAERTIFPVARERGIAVVIDVPLGGRFGSLLRQVAGRPLPPWAAQIGAHSWSQLLLKYVISSPAVTCAIPGSTKVEHLVDDQLAGHEPLPDAAMRRRMEQYWDRQA